MSTIDRLETLVDACLEAHEALEQAGTPEMRTLIRIILLQIGRKIANHQVDVAVMLDDD